LNLAVSLSCEAPRFGQSDYVHPQQIMASMTGVKPEEIAELMAFLVSPGARRMPGSAVRTDGNEVNQSDVVRSRGCVGFW
jgi:NAD(P)-dependent dehydrogenase (short-subunit alcohol dehydrogenase family)